MASALPGNICVGQHSVCVMRVAQLDADCSPTGGADSGIVTSGIVTATASPVLKEGQTFEPLTGCGDIGWTYEEKDQIRSFTVTGELLYFDHELMSVLFGGTVVVGDTGTDFDGDNIGWAAGNYTDTPPESKYVEFVTKVAGQGVGDCGSGTTFPEGVGHIFGKADFVPGDATFANEVGVVNFTGKSVANNNLGDGPWDDWPGTGNIPNSPYIQVSYGATEYAAIEGAIACGYATLPANT